MLDMRRYERVRFSCPVNLIILPQGTPVPSQSLDLSIVGAGIATRAHLKVGQSVVLDFLVHGVAPKPEQMLGRVMNVRAESEGNIVGIEFWRMLDASKQPMLMRNVIAAGARR